MRCSNCGWDEDSPNITTCTKCGHPLYATAGTGSHHQANGLDDDSRKTSIYNGGLSPMGEQMRPTVVQESAQTEDPQGRCPKCGYTMTDGWCGQCGYSSLAHQHSKEAKFATIRDVAERMMQEPVVCEKCGEKVPHNFSFCPKCGAPIVKRTINPFSKPAAPDPPQHRCKLTPLQPAGTTKVTQQPMEYVGDNILLNRENTVPGNRTITSKEQAILQFDNGHWTIENRSEYPSTMLAANRKLQLQTGDVILLGDSLFRFETDEEVTH